MKIRGSGNGLAIALGGLAVVIAATGTAYAVTVTTVRIADPSTPSRIAHVDGAGRLQTAGPLSTLDAAGYLTGYNANGYTFLTSPTTASLALTRIRLSNPARNGSVNEQIGLYQVATDSAGGCTPAAVKLLGYYNLAAGAESVDPLEPALLVKPRGTAKYCLAATIIDITSSPSYYSTFSVVGYVYAGTYTGLGTPTSFNAVRSPKIVR